MTKKKRYPRGVDANKKFTLKEFLEVFQNTESTKEDM